MPPEPSMRDVTAAQDRSLPVLNGVDNPTKETGAVDTTTDKTDGAGKATTEADEQIKSKSSTTNTNSTPPESQEVQTEKAKSDNNEGFAHALTTGRELTFSEDFADAVLKKRKNEENYQQISAKATNSTSMYNARQVLTQEKDDDKLDIRTKQAVLHLTLTDMRIKEMEKEIKLLRRDVDGLPADFEKKKRSKLPVYDHKLKRSTLSEFRLTDESKNIPKEERPALEVLVTDHTPPKKAESTTDASDTTLTGASYTKDRQAATESTPLDRAGINTTHQSPERLRIRSRPLAALVGRISGQELLSSGFTRTLENPAPVVLLRPFKLLVTYEAAIRAEVRELEMKIEKDAKLAAETLSQGPDSKKELPEFDNEDLLADLKLLVEFLDVDLKPTFELRKKIKDGTATSIEFQDLWHLFESGDVVVDQTNRSTAYRVLSYTGGRELLIDKIDPSGKPTPVDGFTVDCYNLHFNGSVYGPKLKTLSIRKFRGSLPILSLNVYPMRFDASYTTLREELISQGTEFIELTKLPYAHKTLVGTTLDEPAEEIDAQVIVDMKLAINKNTEWATELKINEEDLTQPDKRETHLPIFCQHHPKFNEGCCGSDVAYKDLEWDGLRFSTYFRDHRQALGLRKESEIVGDDVMLLPSWVYGFVLRSRRWITMKLRDLADVKYESTFKDLVLPQTHKDSVEALVQDHAKSSAPNSSATSKIGAAMDLVRGKGKGLIILLHGEPGVGKTSTAECVADLTRRPLFPITCGDIGETASEVQTSLDYNFQLAHKWGCVLLLDEADVFLTKRSKTDLRRNAVVSVFLRTLEYYSGILFLTTNRVGSIDPAFKSRIHMSLFYPHFNEEATMSLYEVFLQRTIAEQKKSEMAEFKIKPNQIRKFAVSHYKRMEKKGLSTWNGRQIRNAFQTAIALAEYEARRQGAGVVYLGRAQFEVIATASEEFDNYLKHTLGDTDADIARKENIRSDYFNSPALNKTSKMASRPRRHNRKDPQSETEDSVDDSEEDDDDDDDDDDSEEEDDHVQINRKAKATTSVSSKGAAAAAGSVNEDVDEVDIEEFKRFKQFQKMGKI